MKLRVVHVLATMTTAIIITLLMLSINVPVVHARSMSAINVNNCTDASLRGAIASATDGDTLTFACNGHIRLTSTLAITKNLTLDGDRHTVTLDGNAKMGVFSVSKGVQFSLIRLTVTGGRASSGGGLSNNGGTVMINMVAFAGNSAVSGGGIYNGSGTVTVKNSSVIGNQARDGGGVYSAGGTTTVNQSTVTGNEATSSGGGVYNTGGMVTVLKSSVTGNHATTRGGGINNTGGTVTIRYSSIVSNRVISGSGGGIATNSGTIAVSASIVADNQSPTSSNCAGTITSGGENLGNAIGCNFSQSSDQHYRSIVH
jgi:hypothetical protein